MGGLTNCKQKHTKSKSWWNNVVPPLTLDLHVLVSLKIDMLHSFYFEGISVGPVSQLGQ